MFEEKDYIKLSKKVYENMDALRTILEETENASAWIRDAILDGWIESRGVKHLYDGHLKLGNRFVSDMILNVFCSAYSTEEADQELNFVLLRCCKEGVDIC